jgi:hypothetical protein
MIEYSQEDGRVGQDRQASENIMVIRQGTADTQKEQSGSKGCNAVRSIALIK